MICKDYICYRTNGELEGYIYTTATGENRKLNDTDYANYIKENPHGADIYTGSGHSARLENENGIHNNKTIRRQAGG